MAKKKSSASSPRERRVAASEIFSQPLSNQARRDLARLAALPDTMIDFSDAPEVVKPARVVVGKFYRPIKQAVSLRVDADVLAWFRNRGPGYQTYINDVLRREMQSGLKRSR